MGWAFKCHCRHELFSLEANREIRGKREEKSHAHVAQTSGALCNNRYKEIVAHKVDEHTLGGLSCLNWSVADLTNFLPLASVCMCVWEVAFFSHGFSCSLWDFRCPHLHFHECSSAHVPPTPAKAQPSVFISCAQLSVFIYYAVWKPQKQWVTLDEGIWNSPLTYQPDQREEAWRFISYMFVHAGWASEAFLHLSSTLCLMITRWSLEYV